MFHNARIHTTNVFFILSCSWFVWHFVVRAGSMMCFFHDCVLCMLRHPSIKVLIPFYGLFFVWDYCLGFLWVNPISHFFAHCSIFSIFFYIYSRLVSLSEWCCYPCFVYIEVYSGLIFVIMLLLWWFITLVWLSLPLKFFYLFSFETFEVFLL